MTLLQTARAGLLASGFALVGAVANASVIADFSSQGSFFTGEGPQGEDALLLSGGFEGNLFDPGFDLDEVNDFTFAADLSVGAPSALQTVFDDSFVVEDVTGNDILGFVALLVFLEPALLDAIVQIVDELDDSDDDQTEILPGLWLGANVTGFTTTPTQFSGRYRAVLSTADVGFNPIDLEFGTPLAYDLSASISLGDVAPVPLPATLPLLAFAGAGLFGLKRRRKSKLG